MKKLKKNGHHLVKIDKKILTMGQRLKARAMADYFSGKPQLFRMEWEADETSFPLPNSLVFESEAMARAFIQEAEKILGS